MSSKFYVGDTGLPIVLDCVRDISTATQRSIEVLKPTGAAVSWAASASGTTAIRFDTLAGSLDMPGAWRLQAVVTFPSGPRFGATVDLQVYDRFD